MSASSVITPLSETPVSEIESALCAPEAEGRADPGLYRSAAFRIAERRVAVRIEEGFDAVLIAGDSGTGKSTLLSVLADHFAPAPTLFIRHTPGGVGDLTLQCAAMRGSRLEEGHDFDRLVILVDDADAFPVEMLLDAQAAGRTQLGVRMQFVLAVSPDAVARYRPCGAALENGVVVCQLGLVEDDEVGCFVEARLAARDDDTGLFTREAITRIAECAGGLPCNIDRLCQEARALAKLSGVNRISAAIIDEAALLLNLSPLGTPKASAEDVIPLIDSERDAA